MELYDLKYKRDMYASNPNIRERCQALSLAITNCKALRVAPDKIQKLIDELEMWVDLS